MDLTVWTPQGQWQARQEVLAGQAVGRDREATDRRRQVVGQVVRLMRIKLTTLDSFDPREN